MTETQEYTPNEIKIAAELQSLDSRLQEIEKILKKSTEKTTFELMMEIERIKDILLEETPTGREKVSKFGKLRIEKFRGITRRR